MAVFFFILFLLGLYSLAVETGSNSRFSSYRLSFFLNFTWNEFFFFREKKNVWKPRLPSHEKRDTLLFFFLSLLCVHHQKSSRHSRWRDNFLLHHHHLPLLHHLVFPPFLLCISFLSFFSGKRKEKKKEVGRGGAANIHQTSWCVGCWYSNPQQTNLSFHSTHFLWFPNHPHTRERETLGKRKKKIGGKTFWIWFRSNFVFK